MGLASKLAAAQGGATPVSTQYEQSPGQSMSQQPPPALQAGQRPALYPGQTQYQAYTGATAAPPSQAYPVPPPPTTPHPYPQNFQQPPYSQLYNQQNYSRPPPPPPQQPYGGYPQQNTLPYQSQPSYPPTGYGQPGQFPPQQLYPPQQQFPPQQNYHPKPNQQHGAPPPPQSHDRLEQVQSYKQLLQACIQENHLQFFYSRDNSLLEKYASDAIDKVDDMCATWRIPREVGRDIVKLALYDIILYIDDSGSMQMDERGERIEDLKLILDRVSYAGSLFDSNGISVRFMNWDPSKAQGGCPADIQDHIAQPKQIKALMAYVAFQGLTHMGTELRAKIIEPMVLRPARARELRKPVLVIAITDGQPAGEPPNTVFDVIHDLSTELSRLHYGRGACVFQFAQVGNDRHATEFLAKLDNEPGFGDIVDCTSNFENEQVEMSKANPPVNLTPDIWLLKLLLGAIDSSYDTKDETSNRPPGGSNYGGPLPGQQYSSTLPPGQYSAPQPRFSQQPGSYNQQQGNNEPPPQAFGQAPGGYNQPPPQQAFPQQGGYTPQQH